MAQEAVLNNITPETCFVPRTHEGSAWFDRCALPALRTHYFRSRRIGREFFQWRSGDGTDLLEWRRDRKYGGTVVSTRALRRGLHSARLGDSSRSDRPRWVRSC